MNIGDELTRNDGAQFRLVGVQRQTGDWIAERIDTFEAAVVLSADALAADFAVDGPASPPAPPPEQAGWESLSSANVAARLITRDEPTPEDVFAAAPPPPPKPKAKPRK